MPGCCCCCCCVMSCRSDELSTAANICRDRRRLRRQHVTAAPLSLSLTGLGHGPAQSTPPRRSTASRRRHDARPRARARSPGAINGAHSNSAPGPSWAGGGRESNAIRSCRPRCVGRPAGDDLRATNGLEVSPSVTTCRVRPYITIAADARVAASAPSTTTTTQRTPAQPARHLADIRQCRRRYWRLREQQSPAVDIIYRDYRLSFIRTLTVAAEHFRPHNG